MHTHITDQPIRRYYFEGGLDVANMRPALEHGCGKQTPSARMLFSRVNLLYVLHVTTWRSLRLGLCTFAVFAQRIPLCRGDFRFYKRVWPHNSWKVAVAAAHWQRHSFLKVPGTECPVTDESLREMLVRAIGCRNHSKYRRDSFIPHFPRIRTSTEKRIRFHYFQVEMFSQWLTWRNDECCNMSAWRLRGPMSRESPQEMLARAWVSVAQPVAWVTSRRTRWATCDTSHVAEDSCWRVVLQTHVESSTCHANHGNMWQSQHESPTYDASHGNTWC